MKLFESMGNVLLRIFVLVPIFLAINAKNHTEIMQNAIFDVQIDG